MKSGNYLSSRAVRPSTLGVRELNFCVRDGNRWILSAIVTGMVYKHPLGWLYRCLSLKVSPFNDAHWDLSLDRSLWFWIMAQAKPRFCAAHPNLRIPALAVLPKRQATRALCLEMLSVFPSWNSFLKKEFHEIFSPKADNYTARRYLKWEKGKD